MIAVAALVAGQRIHRARARGCSRRPRRGTRGRGRRRRTVPAKPRSQSSSHCSPSPSRWLVGSSSSRTVGPASSVPASSARACSPPESRASGVAGSRWSMASARRASSSDGLQGPAAQRLEARLRLPVALQRGGRRVAGGQPRLQRAQLAAHRPHLAEPGAQQLAERRGGVGRLLRQPADALAGAGRRRAAVGAIDAGQQPQQRRLAHAVGPDEPGALAVAEHEREAVEERRAVIGLGQIGCLQHGVLLRRA